MFIHSICPDDRLERVDCVRNAHLYIVSSADKIAAVIVISICFWHWRNTHIQCNQVSAVKRLNASGRGLCLCLPLEAVFMQRLCPGDITWHPGSKWVIFWGLLHKCFFFYWWWGHFELWNLQDVLSIQRPLLCEKIKGNLVSHIMTPLTVMTNNRFILKILVQETLSNISKR